MGYQIDLKGKKFNYLKVLQFSKNNARGEAVWECRCVCGKRKDIVSSHIRNNRVQSCGCKKGQIITNKKTKHGGSHTPLFAVWCSMRGRCRDKKNKYYGGKGIKVENEWNDFSIFRNDMEASYRHGLQLDRIDSNGNYCKKNCRWVTSIENNQRRNFCIRYNNETAVEASRRLGGNIALVSARIRKGWCIKKAFTTNLCGKIRKD